MYLLYDNCDRGTRDVFYVVGRMFPSAELILIFEYFDTVNASSGGVLERIVSNVE